jgi:hypothetical protein
LRVGNDSQPERQNALLVTPVAAHTKSALEHVNNSHKDGALPKVRQAFGICKTLPHGCSHF